MRNLTETAEAVKIIAEKAGSIVMSYLSGKKETEHKGDIDLVTVADKESEKYITENLVKLFPEDTIIAEEGYSKKGNSGYKWIIDPLDGTTSFAHNFPFFAVSIAMYDDKQKPLIGIVYNPFFNEYFEAKAGEGATLNNKPIFVSKTSKAENSLIGTGFPYNRREKMNAILERLSRVLFVVHDVRRTGSAALDICYVAAGRLDAYYEEGLKPWDTAAAYCILLEAGGMATKFNGDTFDIDYPEIIASNENVHANIIKLM